MTRDGAAVIVLPAAHGRIEVRLVDAGEMVGRITLAPERIRGLIEQLELVGARAVAARYAASEPLARDALK